MQHPPIPRRRRVKALCAAGVCSIAVFTAAGSSAFQQNNNDATINPSGIARTFSANGALDLSNPFFQDLGTNGRSCVTCHQHDQGWGISAEGVRARFEATAGTDPIFRLNDGSVSPDWDVSTVEARRKTFCMLTSKGLIRVGIPIPPDGEFTLDSCDDPYGYASPSELSLFRRPLPSTNLRFVTTVMWDGRESHPGMSLNENLMIQSNDATIGHAQGGVVPEEIRKKIVDFEMGLHTAQAVDNDAGELDAQGANGGAHKLSRTPFHNGINDVLGADPSGIPFDNNAMTLFSPWSQIHDNGKYAEARRRVARGQALFNSKPIDITGVKGLNDALNAPVIHGFCTSCHDSPNVGNHSLPLPIDIGLADASRRTPDMPLYTLKRKSTGETIQTTDPGRALITGRWSDIGKFKGPVLRGLAARAPYFHNGSAATLDDAVEFYNTRFDIGFTAEETRDLAAFLRSL